ncbi:MAG: plasma-membrane proton-efflux P-type ATPase [Hyphomicrobiales bacterium]|nr:plasma-membrane proton-efflux P-type ATPase [Hyphomicrobiales bacterium]
MIELIVLVSMFLHKWTDFWVGLGLLAINAILSWVQERRAAAAVSALRKQLQVTARVLRDGVWRAIPARELVPEDVIRVRTGDFTPADAAIANGSIKIDQSALTGESQLIAKRAADVIYSGSIVREGEATAEVSATGMGTYFGRTTHLVESARPKLHVEQVIGRVVRWLFGIVGILVAVTVGASLLQGVDILEILPLSLVLLMSAVPVALPAMFTVSMAVGSMELARSGVLVTRLSAAEDAANMDIVCADKTGTLTANRLSFAGAAPQPGYCDNDVLRAGAIASQEADQDPIDLAFIRAANERGALDHNTIVTSFKPFSPQTRRTEAVIEHDGARITIIKGALRTIASLAGLDATAIAALEADAIGQAHKGVRVLAVAQRAGDGPWAFLGLALFQDAPRPDSRKLIEELRALGVSVKMLTGDALPVAQAIATELGLGEIERRPTAPEGEEASDIRLARALDAADGLAEVFPEDKYKVVKSLQVVGRVVGMTGDGVNDAPALRQAEVGIAVSGATDIAKGAASVVLTAEGLGGIVELVKNGRAIYQRVLTWIINKVSRTVLKSGFVTIAFLATGKFAVSALSMILLVFMTDFVKISLATDRVRPSRQPETWNIGPLVRLGVVLGIVMLAEALALLAFGWRRFDLGASPGHLQTFAFETLLFFALFSVVSIRERRAFWRSRPSTVLGSAVAADAFVAILIARFGLGELSPIPWSEIALIVGVAAICCLGVNDAAKVFLPKLVGSAVWVRNDGTVISSRSTLNS